VNIPVKTYNISVSAVGYKTFTLFNSIVTSGNENTYTIELDPEVATLGEIVVKSNRRSVRAATVRNAFECAAFNHRGNKEQPWRQF
jgi:hypothetical protein